MQSSRFVRRLAFLLVLGIPGFGSGCGSGSTPMAQEDAEKVRVSHKGVHDELKQAAKDATKKQSATRKGAHRGAGGG